jgi:predicted alpha/beta superfamily hydrolase
MNKLLALFAGFLCTIAIAQELPDAITFDQPIKRDTIIYYNNFPSTHVKERNVEVWLPKGYPQEDTTYKLLYMHDGQNVLNAFTSTNKISWEIDEKLDSLMSINAVPPTIVVNSWSIPATRFNEYMPAHPDNASKSEYVKQQLELMTKFDKLFSDDYLKFITQEVLPFIETNYQVSKKPEDRVVMGASMGGLISLYAMMEYPEVFGRAGCVSPHWPVPYLGDELLKALPGFLPDPSDHKIYFDHGTETLDHNYEPYQLRVNEVFENEGYDDSNYMYRKFEGHEHSEKDWTRRVAIPLVFLLN